MKPIHVIVVLVVLLILFGAPKLPEFARSLGKSLRILKEEAKALTSDDDSSKPTVEDEANDK
jgi:sec-independent protein translocase protein TatA